MSIIIDEASTASYKIVLIIYLRCEIQDFEDNLMVFCWSPEAGRSNIWNNLSKFIADT